MDSGEGTAAAAAAAVAVSVADDDERRGLKWTDYPQTSHTRAAGYAALAALACLERASDVHQETSTSFLSFFLFFPSFILFFFSLQLGTTPFFFFLSDSSFLFCSWADKLRRLIQLAK